MSVLWVIIKTVLLASTIVAAMFATLFVVDFLITNVTIIGKDPNE